MSKDWYPVIEEATCSNCLDCVAFCSHGMFDKAQDKPVVIQPDNCIEGCRGCQERCPEGAISYFGDDGTRSGSSCCSCCS